MLIPIGRDYQTKFTGRIRRQVGCENCGFGYSYEMRRTAYGAARSLLWLDNQGAADRAEQRAHGAVVRMLERHCDPVRCPRCRWLQREMLREVRRRAMIRWSIAAVVATIIWLGWTLATNPEGGSEPPDAKRLAVGAALVVAYLAVVTYILLRDLNRGLRRGADAASATPNADA